MIKLVIMNQICMINKHVIYDKQIYDNQKYEI